MTYFETSLLFFPFFFFFHVSLTFNYTRDFVTVHDIWNIYYGGYGRVICLDQVQCNGTETSLLDCPAASSKTTAVSTAKTSKSDAFPMAQMFVVVVLVFLVKPREMETEA